MDKCERCEKQGMRGIIHSKKLNGDYCYACYYYMLNEEKIKTKMTFNLCLDCGKDIEPLRCPHCKGIIKYPRRCLICRIKKRKNKSIKV